MKAKLSARTATICEQCKQEVFTCYSCDAHILFIDGWADCGENFYNESVHWCIECTELPTEVVQEGKELTPELAAAFLVQNAPPDTVNQYLERIEKELLPQKNFKGAQAVIENLLKNQYAMEDRDMRDKVFNFWGLLRDRK